MILSVTLVINMQENVEQERALESGEYYSPTLNDKSSAMSDIPSMENVESLEVDVQAENIDSHPVPSAPVSYSTLPESKRQKSSVDVAGMVEELSGDIYSPESIAAPAAEVLGEENIDVMKREIMEPELDDSMSGFASDASRLHKKEKNIKKRITKAPIMYSRAPGKEYEGAEASPMLNAETDKLFDMIRMRWENGEHEEAIHQLSELMQKHPEINMDKVRPVLDPELLRMARQLVDVRE